MISGQKSALPLLILKLACLLFENITLLLAFILLTLATSISSPCFLENRMSKNKTKTRSDVWIFSSTVELFSNCLYLSKENNTSDAQYDFLFLLFHEKIFCE